MERTLRLKARRKLKPGGYTLSVRGADAASGAAVATTVKFRLKR